jgi:putative transposase
MIYKLGLCAERSWRRLRGFQSLAEVIDGVKFQDGMEARVEMHSRAKRQPSRVAA